MRNCGRAGTKECNAQHQPCDSSLEPTACPHRSHSSIPVRLRPRGAVRGRSLRPGSCCASLSQFRQLQQCRKRDSLQFVVPVVGQCHHLGHSVHPVLNVKFRTIVRGVRQSLMQRVQHRIELTPFALRHHRAKNSPNAAPRRARVLSSEV